MDPTAPDLATPPALEPPARGRRRRHVSEYAALSRAVQDTGLFKRRYAYYWWKIILTIGALPALTAVSVWLGDSWWQILVAGLLGVAFTQLAFLGHDGAHFQILASHKGNERLSLALVALTGVSYDWWTSKHNRHHANPNKIGTDPDIDSRVLAFTPQALAARRPITRWIARRQGWLFFPLCLLEGLNLHVQTARKAFGPGDNAHRRWEIATCVLRLGIYPAAVFLLLPPGKAGLFLGVQLAVFGFYMACSFAPNHKGMALVPADMRIDFLRRQVLTSRNIRGNWLVDWLLGGLNYQVEHHLFPSMPRPNLRRIQPLVRRYCRERSIAYTETGLFASYGRVVAYLNDVGLRARDPFECPIVAQYRAR